MSYLLDKKARQKKIIIGVVIALVFCLVFYFRTGVFGGLSNFSQKVFRPVLVLGNKTGSKFHSIGYFFSSKNSLSKENANLKSQIETNNAAMVNYNAILAENISLKELLGRKMEKTNTILSAILAKPNVSVYDTLIIDTGTNQGVSVGDKVFALSNIPIGRVSDVYANTSKVILFTSSGEKLQVSVPDKTVNILESTGNAFLELVGRGGGNFEMILPRNFILEKGESAVLPGITPYVVATVETVISDPRDPFIKALFVSPVNIQELKFVEVVK